MEIGGDIEKTRTIKADHVERLKQYFKEAKDEHNYFQACLLEATLNIENPALDRKKKQQKVYEFEKFRCSKLNDLTKSAQQLLRQGRNDDAARRIQEFLDLAAINQTILHADFLLPNKMMKWKYPNFRTLGRNNDSNITFFVATEKQMNAAIAVMNNASTEVSVTWKDSLIRKLKIANLYKQSKSSHSAKIQSEIDEIENELELLESASGYPSVYLAKFEKYEIDDNGPLSYHFNVSRTFQPVKRLGGKKIESENFVFTDDSPIYRKDDSNKKDPFNLARFNYAIPKPGEEVVLLARDCVSLSGSVHSGKMFPATKGIIDLAKRLFPGSVGSVRQ